ncbi:rhomboid family intramembrane serine protease [Marinovum sp. 2_MG-2023]|uniref:rhomboid family intramembrane serine protease n=1 Tax=unclassified Marinovum TaxID=2647166 RepID=UPI0026E27346|nr:MULTISPECIES: rhomboid family intramembrane serine protease [unclassified Marinovum]MDO6732430.1 rhomboid family intramembrane serine protease [Marinovum sp. 2_MG-2023]MDO6781737.1 rhomboid family intramembrane serine protease [Marinovum sp. 1_MG-2023]
MFPIRDHNPSGRRPYITYVLMAVNIAVFLISTAELGTDREMALFYWDYALLPGRISAGEGYLGLLTSMFLHGGFMHLAGNMLFLYIFGDNIEDEMGHLPYLVFYLGCGLAASLLQYAAAPNSMIPVIGASGAIAGVMGGYLLLFPKAKVDILLILIVFFRVFPVPAWIMLGLWFALQLFGGFGTPSDQGGVAYWAHAGGFLAGMVFTFPLWMRLGGIGFWRRTEGHPPHPDAKYNLTRTSIPKAGKRRL